ncbi:MAG: hypothetical protein AB8G11_18190 [Saprospiraceae bacterium]
MDKIQPIIDSLNDSKSKLEEWAGKIVLENEESIIDIYVNNQIKKNKRSDGSFMPKYSPSTESYWRHVKKPRNNKQFEYKKRTNYYDLDWSGKWMKGLKTKSIQDGFNIFSKDEKDSYINKIAKGDIKRLTDENLKIVNDEIIKPYLYKKVLENSLDKFI